MTIIDDKIVYLEITSFRGMSIGAIHWYGKLFCKNPYREVELKRKLTRRGAELISEQRNDDLYLRLVGEEINGFDSESDIKRLAKKVYKKYFPDAKILLLGNPAYVEVKLAIDAPKDFIAMSRKAYQACDKLGWNEHPKNDRIIDKIYDTWHKALEKAVKQAQGNNNAAL